MASLVDNNALSITTQSSGWDSCSIMDVGDWDRWDSSSDVDDGAKHGSGHGSGSGHTSKTLHGQLLYLPVKPGQEPSPLGSCNLSNSSQALIEPGVHVRPTL